VASGLGDDSLGNMLTATSAQLTEENFAAVRAMPGFRRACETASAEAVGLFANLEPAYQWITKDLGRAGICMTAAILHYAGELTVQSLTAACVGNGVSSPGRVNQVARRCQEIGQLTVEDGPGIWTRRRAHIGSGLLDMLHQRGLCDMKAAMSLTPELSGGLEIMRTEAGAVSALMHLARVSSERRDLFAFGKKRPINFFLDREAGMSILFDLLASQRSDRTRLLEEAPLSRYALARRYGVSRAHINKLLSESGHAQAIGDRVMFSETLSEALEAHFALVFAHNHGAARTLLKGWRYRQPGSRPAASASAA
jgi:hypothetical protein